MKIVILLNEFEAMEESDVKQAHAIAKGMQGLVDVGAKIKRFPDMIKSIWVLGGEPLLQDKEELLGMLRYLQLFKLPIYLFTRFEIEDVPEDVKVFCSFVKCGMYDERLRVVENKHFGINLMTSNQYIVKIA